MIPGATYGERLPGVPRGWWAPPPDLLAVPGAGPPAVTDDQIALYAAVRMQFPHRDVRVVVEEVGDRDTYRTTVFVPGEQGRWAGLGMWLPGRGDYVGQGWLGRYAVVMGQAPGFARRLRERLVLDLGEAPLGALL